MKIFLKERLLLQIGSRNVETLADRENRCMHPPSLNLERSVKHFTKLLERLLRVFKKHGCGHPWRVQARVGLDSKNWKLIGFRGTGKMN